MAGDIQAPRRTSARRRRLLFVVAASLAAFLSGGAAPAHAEANGAPGRQLLGSIVRDGLVDYDLLARRRNLLDADLRFIAAAEMDGGATDTTTARAAQRLAFYINAYNLATLDLVDRERRTRHGTLKSIREIPAAWTRPRWKVAGVDRTLDGIEHDVLRKEFREPRIHMALVCASRSCPALRSEPYAWGRLEEQLEDASRAFVNDSTRNVFTPRAGRLRISKIFDWYGDDFVGVYRDAELERLYGTKNGAVLAFAARYVSAETSAAWRRSRLAIEYLPYDWSLNAAPAARP